MQEKGVVVDLEEMMPQDMRSLCLVWYAAQMPEDIAICSGKSTWTAPQRPGFSSELYHLLAMSFWTSHFPSLTFSFLNYKMEGLA